MSFSISVSGHSDSAEDEQNIAKNIGQVLADAGPAVTFASFTGSAFNGDPRDLVTAAAGE